VKLSAVAKKESLKYIAHLQSAIENGGSENGESLQ
jgi:hypothetical protein